MTDADRASPPSPGPCPDENTLLSFVEGRLDSSSLDALALHLEGCASCLQLVGMEAREDAQTIVDTPREVAAWTLRRGTSVGRYVVVDEAGRGGTSEVYAAYDPELDRKVALKLLYADAGPKQERREARLLREAKAIAKLSHPNVVTVFDAGTFGDRIFLAMEFIEGRTLTDWLDAGPTREEILRVFKGAARGLAAAHAAGLVHRDFKPHNVMVARDGSVRVMDFGLVLDLGADPNAEAKLALETESVDAAVEVGLTRTGERLGTPRYMAPEQFNAEATDARTDQFSFCVALYEALYGQRPFAGRHVSDVMKSVLAGKVTPPPAKTTVPVWLRRIVQRGLEVAPERRFPSMNALVDALEDDPGVRRRRVALAVAGALAIGAVAVAARSTGGAKAPLCQEGPRHWSDVWAPGGAASPRRDAIHRAFAASGRGFAEPAFVAATQLLDRYVARWLDAYRETCEATALRGEQSAEVLDLRMACLNERVGQAKAVIDVLAHADDTVVENAVAAANGLPGLERCNDVALLRAVVKPPNDEGVRKRIEGLRVQLARLDAETNAGRCDDAERIAKTLIPQARESAYKPFVADVLYAAGQMNELCSGFKLSADRFREAYLAGLGSGHDETAAAAATRLAYEVGEYAGNPAGGREWLAVAKELLDRMGGNPRLESWLLQAEAAILCAEGRAAEGLETFERARALKVRLLGENALDVWMSSLSIGNALLLAGRLEDSRAVSASTASGFARLLGPQHPLVAEAMSNEGEALNGLHRFDDARGLFEGALSIYRGAKADPWRASFALTGLGLSFLGAKRPADAVAPLEEALRARTTLGDSTDRVGETRFALARALWARRDARDRALSLAKQARADYGKAPNAAAKIAEIDGWLAAPSSELGR
jgi:tRNA A-37 threonylcarbamoyl transferase component Bud32